MSELEAEHARVPALPREKPRCAGSRPRKTFRQATTGRRPNLRGWKDQLLAQSIQPIQQFAYTTGKNATDAAMVIDAMDLLYSGRFDGFCIVSSDSDFTRLAARLRESGMTVYGFGERKTPKPFVAACDKSIIMVHEPQPQVKDPQPARRRAGRRPAPAIHLGLSSCSYTPRRAEAPRDRC
jgi:uncharacterized LabA/DUF88 family protein